MQTQQPWKTGNFFVLHSTLFFCHPFPGPIQLKLKALLILLAPLNYRLSPMQRPQAIALREKKILLYSS